MPQPFPNRIPFMDALRSFAMLLGVLAHACFSYTTNCPDFWITFDTYKHELFDLVIFIIHSFRLEIFFFISGFFCLSSYQKKGPLGFIKNRMKRIFLPFLIFWCVIFLWMCILLAKGDFGSSYQNLPIFHLWFLYYLMIFYAIFQLAVLTMKFIPYTLKVGLTLNQWFNTLFKLSSRFPWHILILSLFSLPLLLLMNATIVDTQMGFYPEYRLLIYYGIFFILGCLFQKESSLFSLLVEKKWLYLTLALVCLIILFPAYLKMGYSAPHLNGKLLVYRLLYAFCTWNLVFATLAFFLTIFNRINDSLQYLAEASYWIYLIHLPLVISLQSYFINKPVSDPLKPLVIFMLSTFILLIIYQFWIRKTRLGLRLGIV